MTRGKVVLAYSGGLDTSVAIRWINEKYDLDVIALTVDVGNEKDFEVVRQKALRTGAIQAFIVDARETFVSDFVMPSLQAGTLYQNVYPLATALARPLIAKLLVDYARREGATHVAHGCTGKGNDQVRFDVSIQALAPDLKIIAPVREWSMTRDEEIRYAAEHNIPVPVTAASPYSVDANLWGRSIEAGVLEDPWNEPPEEAYAWTINPRFAPEEPTYVTIDFERGVPVALGDDPERTERLGSVAVRLQPGDLRDGRPVRPFRGRGVYQGVQPGSADTSAHPVGRRHRKGDQSSGGAHHRRGVLSALVGRAFRKTTRRTSAALYDVAAGGSAPVRVGRARQHRSRAHARAAGNHPGLGCRGAGRRVGWVASPTAALGW